MKKINLFAGLKDFLILWSSQTASSLGTSMTSFALVIWVYSQDETASSLTFMTICLFLPTILFRFIAGTMADRWNKKRMILFCDLVAACGTLTILILYSFSLLQVWHLYLINFLLSFMDSFQVPAFFQLPVQDFQGLPEQPEEIRAHVRFLPEPVPIHV